MAKQTNSELLHEIDKKVAVLSEGLLSLAQRMTKLEKAIAEMQMVTPQSLQAYVELHAKEHEFLNNKIDDHENRLDNIEGTERKIYKNVTAVVVIGLVMMLLSSYGLDKFFRP